MLRRSIRSFLALALLAAPSVAAANGRYPAAGLVVRDPAAPTRMAVRTTFGILLTQDASQGWGWVCEQGIGFAGEQDPMVVLTPSGRVLAGLFEGLASSVDGGCDWSFAAADLEGRYVTDLAAWRGDGDRVVALTSNGVGVGAFETWVWLSLDGGASFAPFGVQLPADFLGLTLDIAPSDPDIVWVSGRYPAPTYQGAILRTVDAGMTWESFDVPGSDDQGLPYIGGIHPTDPDHVYVRLDRDPDDVVLVTKDGGLGFETVMTGTGQLGGFALSPDGSEVAIGGEADGVSLSPTDVFDPQPVSALGALCLAWFDDGIYACADEAIDDFTVGVSVDGGATWDPLLLRKELCGPPECPDGSTTKAECSTKWGPVQVTIGANACPFTQGGAAGEGGQGGGGAAAGGCSCSIPADSTPPLALAVPLVLLLRRRRR